MGTTFVVMTSLKLATVFATGIALSTAFQYFHTFEWKNKKDKRKEKGDMDVPSSIGESIRKRARSMD